MFDFIRKLKLLDESNEETIVKEFLYFSDLVLV